MCFLVLTRWCLKLLVKQPQPRCVLPSQCLWPLCLGWSNSISSQHSLIPSRLVELRTASPVGQCQAGESVAAAALKPRLPECFAVVLIWSEQPLFLCVRVLKLLFSSDETKDQFGKCGAGSVDSAAVRSINRSEDKSTI